MAEATSEELNALYQAGRQAWPAIDLARDVFEAFVKSRAVEDSLDDARGPDLYLSCACLERNEAAAEAFVRQFSGEFERAARRLQRAGTSPQDVTQGLLKELLVSRDRLPAKLDSYSGRGSLLNWVRAVAARAVIDLHRKRQHQEVDAGDDLFDKLTDSSNPEVQYLKKHYRTEFKAAFEIAVASLSSRERNTLRHLFLESLTIDEVAALYSIHRSTAARRMASAREALLHATRDALLGRLRVDQAEIESIMRLIDSQFDLSLERLLTRSRTS